MSRLTDRPMARAHEHLASARYAEAAGAFRAVLRIDPTEFQAHFGLADALVARGQHAEAIDGLVTAAEACSEQDDHAAALTLYGKALAIDPGRLELHLDVAMAEAALGRLEAAQGRLEHLAEVYMRAGRTDEAAEVYRCLAGWEADAEDDDEDDGDEQAYEEYDDAHEEQAAAPPRRSTLVPQGQVPAGAVPMTVTSSETMVIPTILITPDGQLMQMPMERQPGPSQAVRTDDSVPSIPQALIEAAHSAPIDLADDAELDDVESTVVAFPPPPPELPERDAAHDAQREDLEAAVVAALGNLAQLEEEDMTLVMQRLPPQPKNPAARRSRTGESRLPEFITKTNLRKPEVPKREAPAGGGKMRVRPAPRPQAAAKPEAAPLPRAGKGAAAPARAGKGAAAPARAGAAKAAPARAGGARAGGAAPARAAAPTKPAQGVAQPARAGTIQSRPPGPAKAPARAPASAKSASAKSASAKPAASVGARSGPGAPPSRARPAPPASAARTPPPAARPEPASAAAPKAVRPNNPLAERLRRRAGLPGPQAGSPRAAAPSRPTASRPTEPIAVRSIKPKK